MIHHFAVYLSKKVITTLPSEVENYDIYIYAFEKFFSQSLTFIFLIVLSIYADVFIHMFIYICFVVLLRGQTSGFHARSPLSCAVLSSTFSMICIYFSKFISTHNNWWLLVFLTLAVAYILRFAPINHILMDFTDYEMVCHKKRTYYILICEVLLIFLLYLFPTTREISITASLAIMTVALFMVLSKKFNQEVKNHG